MKVIRKYRILFFRSILVLTLAFSVFIFWGEFFIRMMYPQELIRELDIYRQDDLVGFAYKSNAVAVEYGREYKALIEINSYGFREEEISLKKNNENRIVIIGDSFTLSKGVSVEDSFPNQLEFWLNHLRNENKTSIYKVINASVGAYAPYHYFNSYYRITQLLNPDVIVIAFSPDDHITPNQKMIYDVVDGRIIGSRTESELPNKESLQRIIKSTLAGNSHLYVLLRNYLVNQSVTQFLIDKKFGSLINQEIQRYDIHSLDTVWSDSIEYIQKIILQAKSDDKSILITHIPSKAQISDSEFDKYKSIASDITMDRELPQKMLYKLCAEENVPFIDLLQGFSDSSNKSELYFQYDPHWNRDGIWLGAKYLAENMILLGF